jgi:hypothetical protein
MDGAVPAKMGGFMFPADDAVEASAIRAIQNIFK